MGKKKRTNRRKRVYRAKIGNAYILLTKKEVQRARKRAKKHGVFGASQLINST